MLLIDDEEQIPQDRRGQLTSPVTPPEAASGGGGSGGLRRPGTGDRPGDLDLSLRAWEGTVLEECLGSIPGQGGLLLGYARDGELERGGTKDRGLLPKTLQPGGDAGRGAPGWTGNSRFNIRPFVANQSTAPHWWEDRPMSRRWCMFGDLSMAWPRRLPRGPHGRPEEVVCIISAGSWSRPASPAGTGPSASAYEWTTSAGWSERTAWASCPYESYRAASPMSSRCTARVPGWHCTAQPGQDQAVLDCMLGGG